MSFARITVVGRLGKDPESRYLEGGRLVVNFSMAADGRKRGNESNTTWFSVSAFGEVAERLATMIERGYIKKGSLLYIEGAFESRAYTGNDGLSRTSNDIALSEWQFIGAGEKPKSQQDNITNITNYGEDNQDMDGVPF